MSFPYFIMIFYLIFLYLNFVYRFLLSIFSLLSSLFSLLCVNPTRSTFNRRFVSNEIAISYDNFYANQLQFWHHFKLRRSPMHHTSIHAHSQYTFSNKCCAWRVYIHTSCGEHAYIHTSYCARHLNRQLSAYVCVYKIRIDIWCIGLRRSLKWCQNCSWFA
jgi:hypothetical protein